MADQQVALITGSSSGIGAAIASRLSRQGLRVVLNSARSADAGQALADSLPDADYVRADISDPEQAGSLVSTVLERHGRLDVLVNNAGVTRRIAHGDLESVTPEVWRSILDVNLLGTWYTTVAAVPALRASGSGSVVNLSSVAGHRPAGSSIPYAVSKAAIEHLTRLLANVLGPEIRVNAVAPGLVQTPWTAGFTDIAEQVRQLTPLKRVGLPEDVAEVVAALVEFRYTTGEVIGLDGGAHLV
jgi:ketoreductase RED2